MDKEKKIEYLNRLEVLIHKWSEYRKGNHDHEGERSILFEMAPLWGVVSEILKGLDYKIEIEMADDSRGKNIKPQVGDLFHNGIFSNHHPREREAYIEVLHSYILSAIEKINLGVIVRENVLPNLNLLIGILTTFPEVVSRLKHRREGKSSFEIEDEYDVQDILYVMLKGSFSTLQYEEPTIKEGTGSVRADFIISDLGTYLEAKYIAQKGRETKIHDQCLMDIQKYGPQQNCNKIVFFVYDPNKCIDNQFAFKQSLERNRVIDGKEIEVITLVIN